MAVATSKGRSATLTGTLVVLAAAAAAAATLYVVRRRKNRVGDSRDGSSSCDTSSSSSQPSPLLTKGGIPIPASTIPDDTREVLTQLFEQAADRIRSLPDQAVSQSDRLLLYALYKQATDGDRSNANVSKPSRFNVVANAKYVAWGKFEGMPKETAMIKYVEASHYLAEDAGGSSTTLGNDAQQPRNSGPIPVHNDNADIVYSEEDEYRSSDEEDSAADGAGNSNDDEEMDVPKGMGMRQSTLAGVETSLDATAGSQAGLQPTTPRKRALIAAATEGNLNDLQKAIDSGTNIAEADDTGQTALHFAADRGAADCVQLLLKNGADANSVDKEGISVLQAAVIGGDADTVRLLLEAGADPDAEDIDGDTPRSCANDDGSEEIKELFR